MTTSNERRAAAREVLADILDDSYGSRQDFLDYADTIIAALEERQFTITPTDAADAAFQGTAKVKNRGRLKPLIVPEDFEDAASAAAGSIVIDEGYLVQAIAAETANLALTQQRLDQINDEWRSLNEQRQNAITQVTRLKARKNVIGQMLDELRAAAESAEASGEGT